MRPYSGSIAGMTSWVVSRHPEWDLMYAAGLTVREISEHCHHGVATIHAHFKARERYEPGTRERHEAALAARSADRPTVRWQARLDEALEFLADNGRFPRFSANHAEASLCAWLSSQRRAYQIGELSAVKIRLLDQLGAWRVHEHQEHLDAMWTARLEELVNFVREYDAMPRYKRPTSEVERVLGVWLHGQHQRRAEGRLRPEREAALDAVVPGWHSKW